MRMSTPRHGLGGCTLPKHEEGVQAQAALFLMNNVHYIVKAVESSEALSVVGQEWIERHKDLIEQYGEEYQASSSPRRYYSMLSCDVVSHLS